MTRGEVFHTRKRTKRLRTTGIGYRCSCTLCSLTRLLAVASGWLVAMILPHLLCEEFSPRKEERSGTTQKVATKRLSPRGYERGGLRLGGRGPRRLMGAQRATSAMRQKGRRWRLLVDTSRILTTMIRLLSTPREVIRLYRQCAARGCRYGLLAFNQTKDIAHLRPGPQR